MNQTQKEQLLILFPEIAKIVDKLNKLGLDKIYYRDEVLMFLVSNTSANDGEALGQVSRLAYNLNKVLDSLGGDKH